MVWNPNSSNSVEIVCVDVDHLASPLCRALLLRRNVDRIDGATYGGQLGVSQNHNTVTFIIDIAIIQGRQSAGKSSETEYFIREQNGCNDACRKGTENLDYADRGLTADVEFQSVAFRYFGTPTLSRLNLTIPSGSVICSLSGCFLLR